MKKSDVDIAVEGGVFDSFYNDIQNEAHSFLEFDIVKYDDATSDELKEEITKAVVLVYEKD